MYGLAKSLGMSDRGALWGAFALEVLSSSWLANSGREREESREQRELRIREKTVYILTQRYTFVGLFYLDFGLDRGLVGCCLLCHLVETLPEGRCKHAPLAHSHISKLPFLHLAPLPHKWIKRAWIRLIDRLIDLTLTEHCKGNTN